MDLMTWGPGVSEKGVRNGHKKLPHLEAGVCGNDFGTIRKLDFQDP